MKTQPLKTLTVTALLAMAPGCERQAPAPAAPAHNDNAPCPLCTGGFNEVAAPAEATPQQPPEQKPAYMITLKDGTKIDLAGLQDHTGRTLDAAYLQERFAGKKIVVYFGFPDCTWFCPPSTSGIMMALDAFAAAGIQPVFITSTLDPKTKTPYTPPRMAEWVNRFNGARHQSIALTGSAEQLRSIYKAMQVNDERGNHVPYMGLVGPDGAFLGSAVTVTVHKNNAGKAYLKPSPQLLIPAIEEHFGLTPKKGQSPQPNGP